MLASLLRRCPAQLTQARPHAQWQVFSNGAPHDGDERDPRGLPNRFKAFVQTALKSGCKPKQIQNALRVEVKEGRLQAPVPSLQVLQGCSKMINRGVRASPPAPAPKP